MWRALPICAIWAAVAVCSAFDPGAAVFVAFFAFFATLSLS